MTDNLSQLSKHVCTKLRVLGFSSPKEVLVKELLEISYNSSIKTEENRFVCGSITYCDPDNPEPYPPILRRADYPSFTSFGRRLQLNAGTLAKLSRAVDKWSASLAVYGTKSKGLYIWGILDQFVHQNTRINKESTQGFSAPGIITISTNGIGDISVYHGDLFLGRLKQNQIITKENDALYSPSIYKKIVPELIPAVIGIEKALGIDEYSTQTLAEVYRGWTDTISRICIGLQRSGTGGSILLSSDPVMDMLDITHYLPYSRLCEATILNVLDSKYASMLEWAGEPKLSKELSFATADAEDRANELTGAVKVVTSLAAIDGLLLLNLSLGVIGFGVKITGEAKVHTLYDGPDFVKNKTKAKRIDPHNFGTRHGSMLRYCSRDRNAIGIVVSQDGHVRLINSVGRSLTMWDNVKLLNHLHDVADQANEKRRMKSYRSKVKGGRLGYTSMPKTLKSLLEHSMGKATLFSRSKS